MGLEECPCYIPCNAEMGAEPHAGTVTLGTGAGQGQHTLVPLPPMSGAWLAGQSLALESVVDALGHLLLLPWQHGQPDHGLGGAGV